MITEREREREREKGKGPGLEIEMRGKRYERVEREEGEKKE